MLYSAIYCQDSVVLEVTGQWFFFSRLAPAEQRLEKLLALLRSLLAFLGIIVVPVSVRPQRCQSFGIWSGVHLQKQQILSVLMHITPGGLMFSSWLDLPGPWHLMSWARMAFLRVIQTLWVELSKELANLTFYLLCRNKIGYGMLEYSVEIC